MEQSIDKERDLKVIKDALARMKEQRPFPRNNWYKWDETARQSFWESWNAQSVEIIPQEPENEVSEIGFWDLGLRIKQKQDRRKLAEKIGAELAAADRREFEIFK
jgi:hypothetical protein